MGIVIDKSQPSIVTVRWPAYFDDADFAAFQTAFLHYIDETPYFVTILDLSEVQIRVAAPMRAKVVDFINEVNARSEGREIATVYVIDSPLIRRTVTALFWFTQPDCPRCVVETQDEALVYAHEALAHHPTGFEASSAT